MGEPRRIGMWWGGLSTGWRVNVVLYGLATVSLLGLLAEITSGGREPRQVEVAGQRTRRTTTTQPQVTTSVATTSSLPATTPAPVPETAVPTSPPRPAPTRPRQVASPPPIGFNPAPPTPTTTLPCRNSTDPRCGPFRWDPPPAPNQPLVVDADLAAEGREAIFTVNVSDPDHPVGDNCADVDYGDGTREPIPCAPAPCPALFGPWTPPAPQGGQLQRTYRHSYSEPGQYTARFTFRNDRDRCPDPYGGTGSDTITITVTVGT